MKTFFEFILETTKAKKRSLDVIYKNIENKALEKKKKINAEIGGEYGGIGHDYFTGNTISPDLLKHWSAGTGRPPHLFYSNGSDHLAIHPSIKKNKNDKDEYLVHSQLPGYEKAKIRGRIDHIRKSISYHSSASNIGRIKQDLQTPLKKKVANSLAMKYPDYTHHDGDNGNEPI